MQVYKDKHLFILILIITGAAVVLVLLETAVPYLRGSISQERDQEHPDGKTVIYVADHYANLTYNCAFVCAFILSVMGGHWKSFNDLKLHFAVCLPVLSIRIKLQSQTLCGCQPWHEPQTGASAD